MSKNKTDKGGLTADDLALIAAILVVIGDLVALWAVIAAKKEDEEEESQASTSRYRKKKPRRRA